MAVLQNNAEGGTVGVTVTTGNSGGASGDAFNQVTITGASSCVFANNVSAHGTQSYRITGIAGDTAKFYLGASDTAEGSLRVYFYLNNLPSTAQSVFQMQNSSFSSMASINLTASNQLRVTDTTGATLFTAAASLSGSTWYRIEMQVIAGVDASSGTIHFQYYQGDSTTAEETYSSTTVNTGTITARRLHVGKINSSPALDANFDDIAYDSTATAIGPYGANVPPVAIAGLDKSYVEPYATVTLQGGGSSDSDGSITSYTWVQTAGTPAVTLNGSGASRTFTAPATIAGTTLTFGLTVTDNDGASSTQDTVSITILPVTERAVIGGVEVPAQLYAAQS